MHTQCYLASIAKLEFDALVRDTERAISSLEDQRESAMQAIEAVEASTIPHLQIARMCPDW
jgi:hypothetical protein